MTNMDFRNSEADTRAELIDPKLKESGWERSDKIRVAREYIISIGRIIDSKNRSEKLSADYALIYKNVIIGIIEAKKSSLSHSEGVAQAKKYAELLKVRFTYSTNGHQIYQIDMETGEEKIISKFPSPDELWEMTYTEKSQLWELLSSVPYETGGMFEPRYYQTNAINSVIKAMAQGRKRILLTLATGTGKTCIAFQIVWKLFNTKWNKDEIGKRAPRILFLADRNILANQAYNAFGAFEQDALCRIKPEDIKKNGKVPTAQHIFFTIFQTFMAGKEPYFGQYEKDFFDFIIIDECHRGGANDESQWRKILDYFDSAVQLGLTATPKRDDNVDTYKYFGEPVYQYSLKDAINDGFLTPFRVREIKDNMDFYEYNPDDDIEGEIDKEKTYTEYDFNRKIQIEERERSRVKMFMSEINQNDKTLVFCATQEHAALVRDLINQEKTCTTNPDYCVRVTANDGEIGETNLRKFQDTSKTIPTILTTSQKLSTGVDAIQIKNIVLMRPVNSMIEFKQIIGRGTRLCDGKGYFTIYDFVNASEKFKDKEWDGEPEPPMWIEKYPLIGNGRDNGGDGDDGSGKNKEEKTTSKITKIKLGKGREVEIISTGTSFWDASGKPISAREFIEKLFNTLPNFFNSEEELREIWSNPQTRKTLLQKLKNAGYSIENFNKIKDVINAPDSDIFDVLTFIAYSSNLQTRAERVKNHKVAIFNNIQSRQHAFIEFVLKQYIQNGVTELDDERISDLIKLKYGETLNAIRELGDDVQDIRTTFNNFQKYLYK
ncbi:MAG: DEAD/DEAH box helicase family protein [Candidatus Gastranaerophilales bacterium]|nr:DEAD/DEAH box helicase family protein [Candidatus Gastranaerophilales bacterium]